MFEKKALCAALLAATTSIAAYADDGFYVSGSIAYNNMDDTGTNGRLTSDFVTGPGTTIPAGAVIPRGTRVQWQTDVDSGWGANLALGWRMNAFRIEAEYAYTENDVDRHDNVRVGGINIDNEDAAVLVTGASANLGISVGDLVANGRGDFQTDYLFVNGYYDFDMGGQWSPYVGVGVGYGWVDVDYQPSGVRIINDDDGVFAYQVMGGLNYWCSDELSFFGGLRWRDTNDIDVRSSLLPATFTVQSENWQFELGARWHL
uniref:P44/Msp2 family outer membrane protein n=1 Tax=Microbulbifer agarilyticus TaxID=260552 RepID=UPI000255913E|nr:P44/Msp2 family outer membrane protein [Microbulbifer agarilyticus]